MGVALHPSNYFGLFPPFPRDLRVFVAMSFAPQFDARWANVIAPAISAITFEGQQLSAQRVDMRQVSDSILTEILDGIGSCRIFVADITTIGYLDEIPIRNANVMYEVGLAQATRLPAEVVLFRSDDDPLNFDVSTVRVQRYDPDGSPSTAIDTVAQTVLSSLREVDLGRSMAVRKVASSLDATSWAVLISGNGGERIPPPAARTMGDMLGGSRQAAAIQALLQAGAIAAEFEPFTPERVAQNPAIEESVRYRITPLGQAVVTFGLREMGIMEPAVLAAIGALQREGDADSSA